jgi:hypothetical protein
MSDEETVRFGDALLAIAENSPRAWVYLPADQDWSLDSKCAILESDEVPPELEDEPGAGLPEFAKRNGLMQTLPVAVVQDIVMNARAQKPDAAVDVLFRAFQYYHENDAFIEL